MAAHRRIARLSVATVVISALMAAPLAGVATANHGQRTLDVAPENINLALEEVHRLDVSISPAPTDDSGTVNVDLENEGGPNDDDGITPKTPDMTCSISAGEDSCSASYVGHTPGRDRWRVWIDHDGRDSTVEADRNEGRNEQSDPGDGGKVCTGAQGQDGEPDCTDVITVLWGSGTIDCDDATGPDTENEANPGGGGSTSNERYRCRVVGSSGKPDAKRVVKAEVENDINDPDDQDAASYDTPDYRCTTAPGSNSNGRCVIVVTQNENQFGIAEICFWIGDADAGADACADEEVEENVTGGGGDEGNDAADAVLVAWEERAAGGIDVELDRANDGLGAAQNLTATVYDQFGEPYTGISDVFFELFRRSPGDDDKNTPATPDLSCTVLGASSCEVTFTASGPGTSLLCAWIGDEPVMEGTNNNGTCNAEPLDDADDDPGSADAPEPAGDRVDVTERIWQFPTPAAVVDCADEDSTGLRNAPLSIRCAALDTSGATVARAEIDLEITGPNDIDAGYLPETPDLSCITRANGRCTAIHGRGGEGLTKSPGTTVYRAWIDADNDNSTTEADQTEGFKESQQPGATPEPDGTDVVRRVWKFTRCTIVGTDRGERLAGTSKTDYVCGLGGDDKLVGFGGNDRLVGGGGDDLIRGDKGNDRLEGGSGNDALKGGSGRDRLNGGPGKDRLAGGSGPDHCFGGPGRNRKKSC